MANTIASNTERNTDSTKFRDCCAEFMEGATIFGGIVGMSGSLLITYAAYAFPEAAPAVAFATIADLIVTASVVKGISQAAGLPILNPYWGRTRARRGARLSGAVFSGGLGAIGGAYVLQSVQVPPVVPLSAGSESSFNVIAKDCTSDAIKKQIAEIKANGFAVSCANALAPL